MVNNKSERMEKRATFLLDAELARGHKYYLDAFCDSIEKAIILINKDQQKRREEKIDFSKVDFNEIIKKQLAIREIEKSKIKTTQDQLSKERKGML